MADTVMVFGQHRVRLFQRNDQPSNFWFMRVQIEGKQYRRSLKTCLLETAKQAAQAEMIELLAKMKAGQKAFSTSLQEARNSYLLEEQNRVTRDRRSPKTAKKVAQRIQRALTFLKEQDPPVKESVAIDSIEGRYWQNYINWRLKPDPDIRRDGIEDELVTIRAWFLWCKEKGWCSDTNIPKWELTTEKQQATRVKISRQDFDRAWELIQFWVFEADEDSDERQKRLMAYTVFETITGGGFRTGEVTQLRRSDVAMTDKEIVVTVRDVTSKVRKTRDVLLAHENARWLRGWLEQHEHLQPDDLIFALGNGKNVSQLFYKIFAKLRKDVLIPAGLGDVEAYHGRHYRITEWLQMGESIHLVAKMAGTSVAQIEKTYSGVISLVVARELAKKKLVYKTDGSYEVKERDATDNLFGD